MNYDADKLHSCLSLSDTVSLVGLVFHVRPVPMSWSVSLNALCLTRPLALTP